MKPTQLLWLLLLVSACNKETTPPPSPTPSSLHIKGADLSFLPEIERRNIPFYDLDGNPKDALAIFKENGCNTVRVRLWHSPATPSSSLAEVVQFAQRIRANGMKVWLDIHYSDNWADPEKQYPPASWATANLADLTDSVYQYTYAALQAVQPDMVQIGNEINNGMLWETGRREHWQNFSTLLKAGIQAAHAYADSLPVLLHYAGMDGATDFFDQIAADNLDFDLIGLSYYPFFHGRQLAQLDATMNTLSLRFKKPIVIAETSYPFTLGWNDYTHNIIGDTTQILSQFPPTPEGQKAFLLQIRNLVRQYGEQGGFCYWGGEWTAFKGATATDGSSWENQALFDFNNHALTALEAFK